MQREAYKGTHRRLLLAFDVGTTFSGISYSILEPGIVPEIRSVTRFPSQERIGGDAKIPSIIYYDPDGSVKAVGADAKDYVENLDNEENLFLSEWFKLHLRPQGDSAASVDAAIPPLPPYFTVEEVFADFLIYLFRCAKEFIISCDPNGEDFWDSLGDNIDFVLSHPNGWEGPQQSKMRQAVIMAGLIPGDDESQGRIQFVTEGEASLHFCLQNGLAPHFKQEEGTVIVDAGGGTIDITAYSKKGLSFKEIARPQCHFKGSIFVTRAAKLFIKDKLQGSKYEDEVDLIADQFDSSAKLRFKESSSASFVKFGTSRDKDLDYDIKNGQLKLSGKDVAKFFDPSIDAIKTAVDEMKLSAKVKISSVFLVGGFGANEYIFARLQEHFSNTGINFCRPDTHVNKAVADGAISFYLDHFVHERVSRWTYGTRINVHFNEKDPDHLARKDDAFIASDGVKRIGGAFSVILVKDTLVSELKEFRSSYWRWATRSEELKALAVNLLCYTGDKQKPNKWIDEEPDSYLTACIVEADTSAIAQTLKPCPSKNSYPPHYVLDFDIILLFGLTEFKAQIAWKENGIEKRGPAKIVYV